MRGSKSSRVAGDVLPAPALRRARLEDVEPLLDLERRCFDSDRLSRRSFVHFLKRGHATLQVAELEGRGIVGYVLVLYHKATALARIYSIAVEPELRGRGVAAALVRFGEDDAERQGCSYMRLEVRPDNTEAIALYQRLGYRKFDVWPDYYEDHEAALRFEKRIRELDPQTGAKIPYYAQTTDFTCGPAALLMALRAVDAAQPANRGEELQLWREATTIFMTAGHGGCGPHGLALAAARRGFAVTMYVNTEQALFIDGVRNAEKKEIMTLVHEKFEAEVAASRIQVRRRDVTQADLLEHIGSGEVPLVLISSFQLTRSKSPHWVVITAMDSQFVYLHDPEVDVELDKTALDHMNVPVQRDAFDRMSRFGKARLRCAVIVGPREGTPASAG